MYNFSVNSVKWFRSYLSNRKHIVRTNSASSSPAQVKYGVPQGSTLGPLLFILYVNDLLLSLKPMDQTGTLMYADDTVLYATDSDPTNSINKNQMLLHKLLNWCSANKLTINTSKTKHMLVTRYPNQLAIARDKTVQIENVLLHNVVSYKYLGVDLEQTLRFDSMVDSLYNKANRKIYSLKNIRPYITSSIASLIYKTCIRPVMEYADFLIDGCTKGTTDKLDRIQKRAVKIIDQARHQDISYNDLLRLYDIESLVTRRKKHHLSVMYRHSQDCSNLENYRPDITLRSNLKVRFKSRFTPLTKVQKSPYNRGVSPWDRLPVAVQRATTKVKFKLGLKGFV